MATVSTPSNRCVSARRTATPDAFAPGMCRSFCAGVPAFVDFAREVEPWLIGVQSPAQYVGGELNQIVKAHTPERVACAIAYPDTYTIGASHLGAKILYGAVNAADDLLAERVYTPWPDMAHELRAHGVPLHTLESKRVLATFDVVGFSLQVETNATGVLEILDLAGIPLRAAERTAAHPLILGGGSWSYHPEAIAPFFDAFVLGDGEDSLVAILRAVRELRAGGRACTGDARRERLVELARRFDFLYVPELWEVTYAPDGTIARTAPRSSETRAPTPYLTRDLDLTDFPTRPIVPYVRCVHDRVALEIMRGCTQGCRFCQAGMITRPQRFRSVATLYRQALESLAATGHDEISLLSLSSSDYPQLVTLITALSEALAGSDVGITLPSLRVSEQAAVLPALASGTRRAGITLAPEAANDDLRRVINKNVTDADLKEGVRWAFANGWRSIKLYYMLGLPAETDADIERLAETLIELLAIARRASGRRGCQIAATLSPMVPKPWTPFQWDAQEPLARLTAKVELLKQLTAPHKRFIRLRWHDPRVSLLEALLCRGDRRFAEVIEAAWRRGAIFDAWDEWFDWNLWREALAEHPLARQPAAPAPPSMGQRGPRPLRESRNEPRPSPRADSRGSGDLPGETKPERVDRLIAFIANRVFGQDEVLPWDHLRSAVTKTFLAKQRADGYARRTVGDCQDVPCQACGVNPLFCRTGLGAEAPDASHTEG